jgi:plasmid maintenance system killer protein
MAIKILPIHKEIEEYLHKRNLARKFRKQNTLFEKNIFHPSLNTELLEPKHMRIWIFRIDKRYRALFIFRNNNTIEVIEVNDHYN